jgi:hypothetical protein
MDAKLALAMTMILVFSSGCVQSGITGQVTGKTNLTLLSEGPRLIPEENRSGGCYGYSLKIESVSYYPYDEILHIYVRNTGTEDLNFSTTLRYVDTQPETRDTRNVSVGDTVLARYTNVPQSLFEVLVRSVECAEVSDNITRVGISIRP